MSPYQRLCSELSGVNGNPHHVLWVYVPTAEFDLILNELSASGIDDFRYYTALHDFHVKRDRAGFLSKVLVTEPYEAGRIIHEYKTESSPIGVRKGFVEYDMWRGASITPACSHSRKTTQGIYSQYIDCTLCGAKFEDTQPSSKDSECLRSF